MFNEIIKTASTAIAGGLVVLVGSTFGYWNKDRELDIRMVDVALTILSAKDDATKSSYAKAYALDLLEKYGDTKIVDKQKWLVEKLPLPVGEWPSATSGVLWDFNKSLPPYIVEDKNSKITPPKTSFDEDEFIKKVLEQLNKTSVPK